MLSSTAANSQNLIGRNQIAKTENKQLRDEALCLACFALLFFVLLWLGLAS
jgi:hypothetical protein